MQLDQALRRLAWRARRRFAGGADNDPLVTVEARTTPPPARPLRRRRPSMLLAILGMLALIAWAALSAFGAHPP